ncbi:uncharacterized protein LOC121369450 [Gigantopelta aegis]|uniref:uncharacterized protein LOC121369450 n=1 Tax=Gigantopelta aegis TaxID=1735272 RepID=UPI001B88BFA8|nr:uncharacterized protein LOC121369450 [Gigantopelta aegis]
MRKNDSAHKLHIQVCLETKQLSEANCSCKAGLSGHCSHIIGLLKTLQGFKLHNLTSVPEQQSCTSIPRQGGHPRGMKIKPIPMSHVVVERPTAEVIKRKPVLCQLDIQKKLPLVESSDVKKLRQLDGTPLG